jgi:hypothetical protein
MSKDLFKGLLSALAGEVLGTYRRLSLQLVRIEATKCYLLGVRMARLSAIRLVLVGLVICLVCFGVLLVHAGLFVLLPWSLEEKAALGILLGTAYAVIGGITLRMVMSEKRWMEDSGATQMLKDAMRPPEKD